MDASYSFRQTPAVVHTVPVSSVVDWRQPVTRKNPDIDIQLLPCNNLRSDKRSRTSIFVFPTVATWLQQSAMHPEHVVESDSFAHCRMPCIVAQTGTVSCCLATVYDLE